MTRRRPSDRLWALVAFAALISLLPDALADALDPIVQHGYYDGANLDADGDARHAGVVGTHPRATPLVAPGPALFHVPTGPADHAQLAPCRRGAPRAPPA